MQGKKTIAKQYQYGWYTANHRTLPSLGHRPADWLQEILLVFYYYALNCALNRIWERKLLGRTLWGDTESEIEAYIASEETDVPQGVLQDFADDLTDRQRVILEILKNVAVNVAVNTKYLSERLGVNRKTIQRDAVALQEKHLIQWVGSDKTGHWEIIDPTDRRIAEQDVRFGTHISQIENCYTP